MQPVFQTPRLLLRPWTLAETELCLAMDREPGVTRYVSGPWNDPAAHRAFIEARTRGPYPSGMGYWTIRRRTDNTFLGWILLIPEDAVGPETEIGWRLMPSVWGIMSRPRRPRRCCATQSRRCACRALSLTSTSATRLLCAWRRNFAWCGR